MTGKRKFAPYSPGLMDPWTLPEYPDSNIYVYVPDTCSPSRPCGLFVFMHGGDTDSPATAAYDWYLNPDNGRLRPFIDHIPFITVAPGAPYTGDPKRWNNPGVCDYIETVIAALEKRFNLNPDRIILGGHSMGGFGAWHVGSLLADRWAGVWCNAGAWRRGDFRSFLGTPVYIAHGKYDCAAAYHEDHVTPRHHDWCGVSFSRAAHELMLRDNIEHVYDEHEGGHSLFWEPAKMSVRRFLNWAERLKRQTAPVRCAVITPRGSDDPVLEERPHSRCLAIDRTTPGEIELDQIVLTGPNIAWTIDEFNAQSYYLTRSKVPGASLLAENLGGNRFTFQTRNVALFTLRLNPEMADLARPLELTVNGKTRKMRPSAGSSHPDYQAEVRIEV